MQRSFISSTWIAIASIPHMEAGEIHRNLDFINLDGWMMDGLIFLWIWLALMQSMEYIISQLDVLDFISRLDGIAF
jgi:hypothetical protein